MRAIALAVVLAGCGGGGTGGGDAGTMIDLFGSADQSASPDLAQPSLTFADFKSKLSAAYCKFVYTCCKPAEQMQMMGIGATQDQCNMMFFDGVYTTCSADVAAGRSIFNPAAGQACVDFLNGATCAAGLNYFNGDNACTSMKMPFASSTQGPGMTCSCQNACKTGYCNVNMCTAYVGKDGDCSNFGVCDPANNQYCDGMSNRCVDFVATGGDCTTLYCNGTNDYCEMNTMKCTTKLADGSTCTDSSVCKNGYCDMTSMKCGSPPPPMNSCTGM